MQVCDDNDSEKQKKKQKKTLTCTLCVTAGYRLGVTNVIINVLTS